MKRTLLPLLLLVGVVLGGCVSVPQQSEVKTSVTAYHTEDFKTEGTITVRSGNSEINADSLEFGYYKAKFEAKLAEQGFTVVQENDNPELTAFVVYGIDGGKRYTSSSPKIGITSVGGYTSSSHTVTGNGGTALVQGSTYTMPTYGVVGTTTSSYTEYTRGMAMDIVKTESLKTDKPVRVYETKAQSVGTCATLNSVFNEMLQAVFTDFIDRNGDHATIDVLLPLDFDC